MWLEHKDNETEHKDKDNETVLPGAAPTISQEAEAGVAQLHKFVFFYQ